MNRIIITVEGGCVTSVHVDPKVSAEAEVIVVDWDNDHEEQEQINEYHAEQFKDMIEVY